MNSNPHIGGTFDDFLADQGILKECEDVAIKQILADQVSDLMQKNKISKTVMAKRMNTSRSSLDRFLDPDNNSVTLNTLHRAASAVGRELHIELR
ncbi:MAG: helix-turn-helix domain-containing protein [Leucothrix sp.]